MNVTAVPGPVLPCAMNAPQAARGRWGAALALGLALCFNLPVALQSVETPRPGPPGRYLLLVETSEAMRPRMGAALRAVETLLASGMHGQLRAGETLGVWTYNQDLYAGELPLQIWTPQTERAVASNVVGFLKSQPCERVARFAVVWPELEELVRESPRLTVLWVNSGGEAVRGTPFDAQINEFFDAHRRAQAAQRMPFVVVLRAQEGTFCGLTLNLAPWPVLLPSFPPWVARAKPAEADLAGKAGKASAQPAETAPAPKATPPGAPARTEPVVRPPLIIVGKKDEPPPPSLPGAETASAKPGPPAPSEPTQLAPAVAPQAVESSSVPSKATAPTVLAPGESAGAAPKPQPTAPLLETPKPPAAEHKPTPSLTADAAPARPADGAQSVASSALIERFTPVRGTGATPETALPEAMAGPGELLSAALSSARGTQGVSATVTATATPGVAAGASLRWVWLGGGLGVVGAVVLWWGIRRRRVTQRASLITRSLEVDRRPPR